MVILEGCAEGEDIGSHIVLSRGLVCGERMHSRQEFVENMQMIGEVGEVADRG